MAISRAFAVRGLTAAGAVLAAASSLAAQAQPPLFEPTTYAVPDIGSLTDVDVADVNGDGLVDIGVLGLDGGYRVLLGRGEGLFFPPLDSPSPPEAFNVTLADVTGDGRADRLLVRFVDFIVQVSAGTGQFHTIGTYGFGGCWAMEAQVGDLNGDSLSDLAIPWGDNISCGTGITTYLGDGQGGFHSMFALPVTTDGSDMQSLAPADLDADGDMDLVGNSIGGMLGRFLGAGDGTFAPIVKFPTKGRSADVADVDADGRPDVLSVLFDDFQVYLGTGQGAFAPVLVSPGAPGAFPPWEPAHLALGDLNGDGHIDAAGTMAGQLLIALGTGTGLFAPAEEFIAVSNASQVRSADVDGDGSLDLVVGSPDTITVLVNERPVWPWSTVAPGLGAGPVVPKLAAAGTLEAGDPLTITLQQGAPGAPAALVVGAAAINAPFKGGVLVPLPFLMLNLPLDPAGGFQLAGSLAAPLPSGAQLYLQTWIVDSAGPVGFTSSNAIVGIAP